MRKIKKIIFLNSKKKKKKRGENFVFYAVNLLKTNIARMIPTATITTRYIGPILKKLSTCVGAE